MRKRFYLVTALSLILVASAPLNASAEALNDSFYSAQEVDENVEIEDFGEIEDEFISDDITEGDLFSSQAEEYSTGESNDSADDGWTQLENESKISLNTIVRAKPFHLGLQSRLHYLIIIKMEVAANGI